MENKTIKSLSDTTGKVVDLINPTDEVKKAGLIPFATRMAKTFSNKKDLKNSNLDNEAIILHQWQKKLAEHVEAFLQKNPDASYNDTKEYLLKKQIKDSTYSLDNDYMRERFAKLIATTATDFEDMVTPLFSNVLSNLDPNTAKLFLKFKINPKGLSPLIYFGNTYTAIYSYYQNTEGLATGGVFVACIASSEIAQLVSLGLIAVVEDYKLYNSSKKEEDLYQSIKIKARTIGMNDSDIKSYAAIRITDFGDSFFQAVY